MELLSRQELEWLTERRDKPSVSIFMATHRAGAGTEQDPIRLKNLLGGAEERLIAGGIRGPEARKLLAPAQELLEDGLFWQHQSDGLAIFASGELFRAYRLPVRFEEMVIVTDRFHIKPLLPLLSGDGRFYVLALSQKSLRLLQGTRFSVSEIELEGVPDSLADALKFDDPERQLQFHTGTPAGPGGRGAMFHGHGAGAREKKDNILRYFRQVDKGLQDLLPGEGLPLVLVGVDYLLPIYREANTYRYLVSAGIEGNPEALSAEELHGRAWAIVQPHFEGARREAISRYRQLAGTGLASANIDVVVPAAYHGRIDTLFVAVGRQQWGAFDRETNAIDVRDAPEPGDNDLLDSAAVQTLSHGGTVYAVELEEVPGDSPLAAIFRY